jgi:hypothetical protein
MPQPTETDTVESDEEAIAHMLPSGNVVFIKSFQASLVNEGDNTYRAGVDVEVILTDDEVASHEFLADEILDDVLAGEAEDLGVYAATVTFVEDSGLTVVPFLKTEEKEWHPFGRGWKVGPSIYNITSPKQIKLSTGQTVVIEGESARPHVRASGYVLFEAHLNWPQSVSTSLSEGDRRTSAQKVINQYWLERGKALAEEHEAIGAVVRLYGHSRTSRFKRRDHHWNGAVRFEDSWDELVSDPEAIERMHYALDIPPVGRAE